MFILVFNIEILGESFAMMRQDEVFYELRKIVFLCHSYAFDDVTDDDSCAFFIWKVVVRIVSCLVFGEESRRNHLSYVVIKSSCTKQ